MVFVQLGHSELELECRGHCVLGGVVVVDRRAEEDEQTVAQDLVDRSSARQDALDGHFQVPVEDAHDLLGGKGLRQSRKASDVGQQKRQLARLASQLDAVG